MALDKTKSFLKSSGSALLTGMSIAADLATLSRMTEIENEIDTLQDDYRRLNEQLSADHRREVPYVK